MIDLSLIEDFITGAGESLDEMETALLELEGNPNNTELLHTIFRAMHTIKGAAQFVGLERVSALSHVLEDLLDLLREGKKQASLEIVDLLIQTKDRISSLVTDLERTQTENTEVDDLVRKINFHLGRGTDESISAPPSAAAAAEPLAEELAEDLSSFLTEEEEGTGEDLGSFLTDAGAEDLGSFLSEETLSAESVSAGEDLAAFLSEPETGAEDLNAFLSEDSGTDEAEEDLAAFLSESIEPEEEAISALEQETRAEFERQVSAETEPKAQAVSDSEDFVLPAEEYDQELFGIFIAQVQEKFALLSDCIGKIATANNQTELLELIIEALESLKFSANYMGYEKLTRMYGRWLEDIVETQEDLTATGHVSFSFMDEYLPRLQRIFPQLQQGAAATAQPVPEKPAPKVEPEKATEKAEPLKTESVKAEPVKAQVAEPKTDTEFAFMSDLLEGIAPEQPAEAEPVYEQPDSSTETASEDEQTLFDKLSQALDASIIEEAITSEPINEVFSALLASTEEERAKVKAEKQEKMALKVKTLAEANEEPQPQAKITKSAPAQTTEKAPAPAAPAKKVEPAVSQKAEAIEEIEKTPVAAKKEAAASAGAENKVIKKSIRVDADKIDSLMNQVGELIVDRAYFFQLANEINDLQQYLKEIGIGQKDLKPVRTFAYRFSEAIISLGRTSNELQEGVMKVRMLPISQLFNRYPRLVHDLAHTNGKKVQLEIRGEETELDKMIIEEISDPLIHMIRNAIGHGIEAPDVRKKLGKRETGTLILEAYHESNHIVIEVSDDGRGIDTERIKAKAEEMGLFSKDELNRMSTDDLIRFIMMPGFSTAKEINSTSGRGVGMDVVKKNIEKLNGTIEVESKLGIETKIRLKIPLTLAIIPALLVRVGVDSYTIPLANVEETLRVAQSEITIMEETEVMYLRGKTLPIFRLSVLFGLESSQKEDSKDFFVVVVNTGNQRIGLMVDALLGQEEVVIKPLADYLHDQNCFSGATIIGDGRISLILDVYELISMTTDKQVKKHQAQERRSLAALESSS